MVGLGAAAISGGLGLAGSIAGGLFGQSNARDAWRQQKKMLQTRYQYTVQDLKKAGLNPMLAMGHGPGQPGPVQQAPTPDFGSPISNAARHLKVGDEKKLLAAQEEAALASAQELRARAKISDNEALKSNMVLDRWMKDSGLASAAAYREAYGQGKIGNYISGGKGLIDSISSKIENVIPPLKMPERRTGSEPISQQRHGIAPRSEQNKKKRPRTY